MTESASGPFSGHLRSAPRAFFAGEGPQGIVGPISGALVVADEVLSLVEESEIHPATRRITRSSVGR